MWGRVQKKKWLMPSRAYARFFISTALFRPRLTVCLSDCMTGSEWADSFNGTPTIGSRGNTRICYNGSGMAELGVCICLFESYWLWARQFSKRPCNWKNRIDASRGKSLLTGYMSEWGLMVCVCVGLWLDGCLCMCFYLYVYISIQIVYGGISYLILSGRVCDLPLWIWRGRACSIKR